MADWNKRYAKAENRLFGDAPNEYLREVLARSDVAPASALCLGDGDGRNGAWLAGRGIAVTAVDISDVATEQARVHDRALGVTVERIVADVGAWTPPVGRAWDAVFMIFLQCEAQVRHRAVARAAAAVSPGGWFVAEGFAAPPAGAAAPGGGLGDGPGPKVEDLLYDPAALLASLPEFRPVEMFVGQTWLAEGEKHRGLATVARLLARRDSPGDTPSDLGDGS